MPESGRTAVPVSITITEFLSATGVRDVRVWLEADQIRCSAPKGVLTTELRDQLRLRRDELRDALQAFASTPAPGSPGGAEREQELPPLSLLQERLWFFHQLEPGSSAYNISPVITLRGPLDVPALERSLEAIVQRHEILRTTFPQVDGEPRQLVQAARRWQLSVDDLTIYPVERRQAEAETRWKRAAEQSFDLANNLPIRTTLLRLGHDEHHLLVTLHHIAADGVSLMLFVRELAAHYAALRNGTAAPLPRLPLQYGEFARREREWLASPASARTLAYWTGRLAGDVPPLAFPTDHPRPAVQSFRGQVEYATLPLSASAPLKALGQRHGCTPFMTLLAAFKALLYRHTGDQEITVGSPVANRESEATQQLIGMFVNTLVLRSDLSGNPTFEALLDRVRDTCLGAMAHQGLPFAKLLEELHPERDLSRTPLFQVMFNMFTMQVEEELHVAGLTLRPPPLDRMLTAFDGQSKFDFTLYARDDVDGIRLILVYNADLFDAARMKAFLGDYCRLVETVALAPRQPVVGDIALGASGTEPGRTMTPHVLVPERSSHSRPISSTRRSRTASRRWWHGTPTMPQSPATVSAGPTASLTRSARVSRARSPPPLAVPSLGWGCSATPARGWWRRCSAR